MGLRIVVLLALSLVAGPPSASPQVATGEIYGKVTDASGAVLPGVTVTLTSPVLLQPLSVVSTETGSYPVPLIPIGTYTVSFELAGFRPVVNEGVRIEIGLHVLIDATLALGGVEEVVEVRGVPSVVVDMKDAGKSSRFTQEALQGIPSARDPWAILAQSAGVAMDRPNVGGSSSGQQGNSVVRGTARESKWSLDGVDITDMASTGSSPVYYDFDALEEIQVTTGGADVTMQSSGLAINLVTKSGTDTIRGSARLYVTDAALQSNNVTDALRTQGASTGNPIQNIQDYGVETGGPVVKGRAWVWGSYGTQRINVGVNNFYRPGATCDAMKANPLSYSLEEIQTCLMTDKTTLETYNVKAAVQMTRLNQFSFLFNAADKIRPTREASDVRPVETTLRQSGTARPDLGSRWWKTGIPKTYRWSDRHVFSDHFAVEAQYAVATPDVLARDVNRAPAVIAAVATCGRAATAQDLVAALVKTGKHGQVWQEAQLPLIRARVLLTQQRPADAMAALEPARVFDRGVTGVVLARGEAYLRSGRSTDAAREFRKILDVKANLLRSDYNAAQVGLARALAASGDRAGAAKAYGSFFDLWKSADHDIPLLAAARSEYARLVHPPSEQGR